MARMDTTQMGTGFPRIFRKGGANVLNTTTQGNLRECLLRTVAENDRLIKENQELKKQVEELTRRLTK